MEVQIYQVVILQIYPKFKIYKFKFYYKFYYKTYDNGKNEKTGILYLSIININIGKISKKYTKNEIKYKKNVVMLLRENK